MFKESKFNIHKIYGGAHYVYNVRTEALVRLKARNLNEPDSVNDVLVRQGFFVPEHVDEVATLLTARCNACESETYQYIRIMTTSCCNARCAYCYEQGQPIQVMSRELALDVARFICKCNSRVEFLELCWFGGEPLLNVGVIDDIISFLKHNHPSKKIVIKSSFITNGSLINDDIVDAMVSRWNVKEVQISLDGYGRDYESVKRYVDKGGFFERVIGNVEKLVTKNISTKLRLNVNKQNIDKIKRLVRYLGIRFSSYRSLHVYPGYLFDGANPNNPDLIGKRDATIRKDLSDFFKKNGFRVPLIPRRRNIVCYAGRQHSFFVTPDGKIYKCAQHYADKTAKPIGSVYDMILNQGEWVDCMLDEQCEKCLALPICQGGCKAARLTALRLERCQSTVEDLNNHVVTLIELYNSKNGNGMVQ